MKFRQIFLAMVIFLSMTKCFSQVVVAFGDCGASGNNLTWTLTSDSVLTIYGSGDMEEFGMWGPYPSWSDYHDSVKTVIIGDSVTTIGGWAFYLAYPNLTYLTIGNSVTTIGANSFDVCGNLASVTIPNSVTTIMNAAFNATGLTSVTIHNNVTTLGNNVFGACNNLTSINVDNSNPNYLSDDGVLFNKSKTTILQYPAGKTGTSYTIPNGVTLINCAFIGCYSLTSVTIPNSVTTISGGFNGCALTSLTIPNSVINIDAWALNCGSLTDIIANWADPTTVTIAGNAFAYVDISRINLHVPVGTENLYKAAPVWQDMNVVTKGLSGKVMRQDLSVLTSGRVSLYKKQSQGRYVFVDSVSIGNDGRYVFANINSGDYVVRAEPAMSESALPTYYGNTQYWDSATIISFDTNSVISIDIIVIPLPAISGNSVVKGNVSEDDGQKSRRQKAIDPVVNADVYIQKSEQDDIWQTTAKTTTNSSGDYEFGNLPAGKYRVILDIPGLEVAPSDSIRLYGNDSATANFVVPKDGVNVRSFKEKPIKIYPNPTTGKLIIENGEFIIGEIEVYDMVGHLIFTNVSQMSQPSPLSQEITIDISHLPNGLYFLKINNKTVKIIKN